MSRNYKNSKLPEKSKGKGLDKNTGKARGLQEGQAKGE